ncbi:hypothetical protein J6590_065824 [Homalodisca vitripennis]|nr:hypothetical protein J6590_065824 [Homalodisca vitripennis]
MYRERSKDDIGKWITGSLQDSSHTMRIFWSNYAVEVTLFSKICAGIPVPKRSDGKRANFLTPKGIDQMCEQTKWVKGDRRDNVVANIRQGTSSLTQNV